MGGAEDSRQYSRIPVSLKVTLSSTDEATFVGLAQNISEGGLFIASRRQLEIGKELQLHLTLNNPNERPITATAVPKWSKKMDVGEEEYHGVGFEFVQIDGNGDDIIKDFVVNSNDITP